MRSEETDGLGLQSDLLKLVKATADTNRLLFNPTHLGRLSPPYTKHAGKDCNSISV